MNNPHQALIEKWYEDLPAIIVHPDVSWTVTPEELLALIDTVLEGERAKPIWCCKYTTYNPVEFCDNCLKALTPTN